MDFKECKEEFALLKSQRGNWDSMYQIVGEYVSQNKQNFENSPQPGAFLVSEIYDATGPFAASTAASSLLGMLWPGSAKMSIELMPPDDIEDISTELNEFYSRMTNRTVRAFDDPKANLSIALDEYMQDQMIFGTSGVGTDRGDQSKLLFKPYGVKEAYIDEGRNGRVDKYYLLYEWTIARLVAEYGYDQVSEQVRKKFDDGKKTDCVKVLIAVMRRDQKKAERGKFAMDYMGLHYEYETGKELREEGFHELPINFGRFRKLNYEKYGRSPAMNALPDIREANALRESVIVATEKALDMPKGVFNDGILGGGVIDTSARAINVFSATGAVGSGNPIFDIGSPPDITAAMARLEELKNSIAQHFFIDRLLDLNNDTQMTFGEAQIRDNRSALSMSATYNRQLSEVLTPTFERAIAILWRDGEFGVLPGSDEEAKLIAEGKEPEYFPDEIIERLENGEDVYQIVYKTQAFNASRAADYIGIVDVVQIAGQMATINPGILNRIDMDAALKEIGEIRGIPSGIIRQDDEVEAMAAQQSQQAQASQQVEALPKLAKAAKDAADADKTMREE